MESLQSLCCFSSQPLVDTLGTAASVYISFVFNHWGRCSPWTHQMCSQLEYTAGSPQFALWWLFGFMEVESSPPPLSPGSGHLCKVVLLITHVFVRCSLEYFFQCWLYLFSSLIYISFHSSSFYCIKSIWVGFSSSLLLTLAPSNIIVSFFNQSGLIQEVIFSAKKCQASI